MVPLFPRVAAWLPFPYGLAREAIRPNPVVRFLLLASLQEVVESFSAELADHVDRFTQPVNFYFWRYFGENPFGHSGRRIADFYAGLVGDFRNTQRWKRLRRTKHDHHPVHDALGNAEARIRIFEDER